MSHIWDVLSRRRQGDDWEVVGSINAPDLEMATLLARETHFRHGEGTTYGVRRRGDDVVHEPEDPGAIGGALGKEYRRQDGYVGVGAKLKRVHAAMSERGLVIDRPRPRGHRARQPEATGA